MSRRFIRVLFQVMFLMLSVQSRSSAETGVLADAQVIETGEKQFLLKLRSTQPQAFDVEREGANVRVVFYQVRQGVLSGIEGVSKFGSVLFGEEKGNVVMTLLVNDPLFRVSVEQGGSAETVDVRVLWQPDAEPPVIKDIKAEVLGVTRAVITWTTDEPASSRLLWGLTQPESNTSGGDSLRVLSHRVELSGLSPSQSYFFRVQSEDAAGNASSSGSSLFQTPAPPFQEISGVVVMEAENFDKNIPRGSKSWSLKTDNYKKYLGKGFMNAGPNTGTVVDTGISETSPQLVYPVSFSTTGTYNIWIRGRGANSNDDSVHTGLNGSVPASGPSKVGAFASSWEWRRGAPDGPPVTLTVSKPGIQTLHLWMREDGFEVDRIMLQHTSIKTTPSRAGPAESPRAPD